MSTKITLTDEEVEAIKRLGGSGYIGLIDFAKGPRGGKYLPARTGIWRTEELADEEVNRPQFKQTVASRRVVLVDRFGEYAE